MSIRLSICIIVLACAVKGIDENDLYDNEFEGPGRASGESGDGSEIYEDYEYSGEECSGSGYGSGVTDDNIMLGDYNISYEDYFTTPTYVGMLTTGVRQKDNVTETGIWDIMSENNEPVYEFSAMGSGMEVGFCQNGDICYNGGTCETVIEESRCLCPVGYTGRDCSYHLGDSPCFDCHQDPIESYRSPRSLENYEVVQMEWKHGANHTGGHILAAQLISVMLEEKRHHNIALASLGGFILILIALFVGYFLSKFIARRNDRRLGEEIYIV